MKAIVYLLFVFGVSVVTVVQCAPRNFQTSRRPLQGVPSCFPPQSCPDDYHPVCAVDAQGLPKTFAGRCYVEFANCRDGKSYAIIKDGEC